MSVTTQNAARKEWSSYYPFEPHDGGDGAELQATTATARVALVGKLSGEGQIDNVAVISNTGSVFAFVRLGRSDVVATTASMAVPPGGAVTVSLYGEDSPAYTYLAAITRSDSAWLQVTTGYGN